MLKNISDFYCTALFKLYFDHDYKVMYLLMTMLSMNTCVDREGTAFSDPPTSYD